MFPIIISITVGVIIALLAVFALPVRPWISRTAKRRSSVALLVAFIAFLTSLFWYGRYWVLASETFLRLAWVLLIIG